MAHLACWWRFGFYIGGIQLDCATLLVSRCMLTRPPRVPQARTERAWPARHGGIFHKTKNTTTVGWEIGILPADRRNGVVCMTSSGAII